MKLYDILYSGVCISGASSVVLSALDSRPSYIYPKFGSQKAITLRYGLNYSRSIIKARFDIQRLDMY